MPVKRWKLDQGQPRSAHATGPQVSVVIGAGSGLHTGVVEVDGHDPGSVAQS